jgi:hypothetical protein
MFSMLFFILRIDKDIIDETTVNRSNSDMNTEFIRYMKCVGAFVKPKDRRRYSNKP